MQKLYLKKVFLDDILEHKALYRQSNFMITDLLTYKIKPYTNRSASTVSKTDKNRVNLRLFFVNKALDMINLPFIFRNRDLKSYVNFCKVSEPSVLYSNKPGIGSKIFNYNQT